MLSNFCFYCCWKSPFVLFLLFGIILSLSFCGEVSRRMTVAMSFIYSEQCFCLITQSGFIKQNISDWVWFPNHYRMSRHPFKLASLWQSDADMERYVSKSSHCLENCFFLSLNHHENPPNILSLDNFACKGSIMRYLLRIELITS